METNKTPIEEELEAITRTFDKALGIYLLYGKNNTTNSNFTNLNLKASKKYATKQFIYENKHLKDWLKEVKLLGDK